MELSDFIVTEKISVSTLAKELGVKQPAVSRWKDGVSIPNMTNMKKLMVRTNGKVMPNDFFTDFIKEKGFNE